MCKLEEYIEEDCRHTLTDLRDFLFSDLRISVGKSSIHRALQGMLYSVKRVHIEKATMNSAANKAKRKEVIENLNKHIDAGNMIFFQDKTNFNLYLSQPTCWSRVGERAVVALPPSQGENLHVQGGVSSDTGIVLLKTYEGPSRRRKTLGFDLFMAALRTDEFHEREPNQKSVIVADNTPTHSGVGSLARRMIAENGVVNLHRLGILRLGPYSPMLKPD
ncbi:hypothetical protein PR003_g10049 [Phytophthora rubi]|uniref:Tc1-like transposase DDE domain-containing protein n=1 Tax=Phytophthora rubi TaxID=129364 RepID=A0A6A4FL99_9STRA|nr:hypothetical protein PR003_g10049 [Phytophthora rubi]